MIIRYETIRNLTYKTMILIIRGVGMKQGIDKIGEVTLHRAIIKLSKTHRNLRHEKFRNIGLTEGQPKVLNFLSRNDGCIQREIAESCNIEPATVTSLLSNMEKAELIYRTQNLENRRILNVFLTDKGKEAQKEVEKIFNQLDEKCFKDFSEEEKIKTIEILNRLYMNMINKE